ncbi:tetratricopeptide repeat protein [Oricola thermophila]|uniref:Uncharacterized protein n=1 Tax=Oricola thermophila TaxID=2742145 RepID=A0A6N1V8Q5_9HYPH|nr:hypothetical protein [Oricola thermophila]QKV17078.1 hypothetical protein HTY61_00650 [Oricola thermophila]
MGDASRSKGIDPGAIRAALDDILRSATFSRSERSRELLRYIVERDLEGEADRLKGFAIALDVFDREDNFDPSTDAVVRVQAGRLRDLLETYYSGEGADARIRITIPRGTYVPVYNMMLRVPPLSRSADKGSEPPPVQQPEKEPLPQIALAEPRSGRRMSADPDGMIHVSTRLFWGATATIVGLLVVILVLLGSIFLGEVKPLPAAASRLASSDAAMLRDATLPSVAVAADTDGELRLMLEDAIPRFGSVVYRNDRSVTLDHPLADFYIKTVQSGRRSLNVQFFHRESGIMIGTDHIPGGQSESEMADHVSRILSRFLPVGGAIYAFLESEGGLNPLTSCLATSSAYFNSQSAERHRAAQDCNAKLLEDGVNSALVYANLASLAVESVTDGYDYPEGTTLDDALRLGRRAVELAPLSATAHRSLAWVLQASGEHAAALQEISNAHAFNSYDLGIAASYGYTLVAVGDFPTAVSVLERATEAAPVHPSWWDYALFLAAFQTGRNDLVSYSARKLAVSDRSHYCAARLIAAYIEGDEVLRKKMLSELATEDSIITRDPLAYYSRLMPRQAAEKFVAVLAKAGLQVRSSDEG